MPKGKLRSNGVTVDANDGRPPTYWRRQLERGEFGAERISRARARMIVGDRALADATAIAVKDNTGMRTATAAVRRDTGKKGKGRK